MQAIQTRYNGYHFRSRTEARWAVFLDTLEIPYDYEPEGFVLNSGLYLPDFRISLECSDSWAWLEVKGSQPSQEDTSLLKELADEQDVSAVMVVGAPSRFQYLAYDPVLLWRRLSQNGPDLSELSEANAKIGLTRFMLRDLLESLSNGPWWHCLAVDPRHATTAAASARFEFGETPQPAST